MKSLAGLSYTDIAFEVCSALDKVGVKAILSGGGPAAVYAPDACETKDLDFELHFELFPPSLSPILELGFRETSSRGIYSHPDITTTLEFLRGPLAVGGETLEDWDTMTRDDLVLYVLTPTDSIKDRLAAAIHFKDFNSARQAAAIAKRHSVNLDAIRSWCDAEDGSHTFEAFLELLKP